MNRSNPWRLGLLTVLLAACSTTPDVAVTPPSPPTAPITPAPPVAPKYASVTLAIVIPAPPQDDAGLGEQYVSSATQSLQITMDGTVIRTVDAGVGKPGCTGTGPVTCTFTLTEIVTPGDHTFAVRAYSGAGATGSLLGTFGPETRTLAAGTMNTLNFTLTGVVGNVQVQPTTAAASDNVSVNTYLLAPGQARTFEAKQYDAAGQMITGPGTPDLFACTTSTDVQITADDHQGHFTVETAQTELLSAPIGLHRESCSGPLVRTVRVANRVLLWPEFTGLPGNVTGPVTVTDSAGQALPDLAMSDSVNLEPGTYTLGLPTLTSGKYRYSPPAASFPVTLKLGEPKLPQFAYSAAVQMSFAVTVSSEAPKAGDPVTVTAQLLGADGQPFSQAGTTVTWSSSSGGSFSPTTSTTDASGKATTAFTTSTTVGTTHVVTASATDTGTSVAGSSAGILTQGVPVARPDAPAGTSAPSQPFHVAFNAGANTAYTSSTAENLLTNDTRGATVGPVGISGFGGGSLGGTVTDHAAGSTVSFGTGGSLKVNADGSFTFTPAQGFTGLFTFNYRLTNNYGSSDALVTLAVGQRPAVSNDAYAPTLLGNVPINTATSTGFKVSVNDQGDNVTRAVTAQTGGTATLNADGTFTFRPTPGQEGAASFQYTATNGFGTTAPATVSLNVANSVWFVNAAASSNGDGSFDKPFNCLTGPGCFSTTTADGVSDRVFLYSSTYTGGLTLLDGQGVYGQGASGSFASTLGVTWPADAGTPPALGGPVPTITAPAGTNGVNLAQNNTLRGLGLGTAGGSALSGTNFGTLTFSELGISTAGQALNLATGTLAGNFSSLNSSGGASNIVLTGVNGTSVLGTASDSLSGATGDAVRIDGGSGSFTYAGTVSNTNALAVNVLNKTGGTTLFSGAINPVTAARGIAVSGNTGGSVVFSGPQKISSGAAHGVNLTNNTGASISFTSGNLQVATTTGAAFNATGGGTVVVKGAGADTSTLSSAGGAALNVSDTTIGTGGLRFQSITANGGPNGILLKNTGALAGLTVSGTGTPGSGGTIQNTAGGDGQTAGNGVYLESTRDVSLNWVRLTSHSNFAIRGLDVNNFTLTNSVVDGLNGNNGVANEGAVAFGENDINVLVRNGVTGTVSITGNSFSGGLEDTLRITNISGTLSSLTATGNTFGTPQGSATNVLGNHAFAVRVHGTAVVSANVRNNTFNSWLGGNAFDMSVQGTGTGTLAFRSNQLSNNNTDTCCGSGGVWVNGGNLTFDISDNTITKTNGTAISVGEAANIASNLRGTVQNNTIGQAGVTNSGSATGSGIFIGHLGAGTSTVLVQNNTIRQINGLTGITVQIGDAAAGGGQGTLNATVTGNTIAEPGPTAATNSGLHGIYTNVGTVSGDAHTACLNISGNIISNFGANRIRPNQRFLTGITLPGYTGANNDNAAIAAYLSGRNTVGTVAVANNVSAGGLGYTNTPGGAPCPQPPTVP